VPNDSSLAGPWWLGKFSEFATVQHFTPELGKAGVSESPLEEDTSIRSWGHEFHWSGQYWVTENYISTSLASDY